MTWETLALLVVAGVASGLMGTVTGIASLVSYPSLLAAGLNPVAANVTNTVALVGSGVGGISGSRPELRGQRGQIRRLAVPAVLGGVTGGILLLVTPSGSFAKIVPWLIALGSISVLIRPRPAPLPGAVKHERRNDRWLLAGTFLISIYGGYFGAAAGVLMIALFLLLTGDPLPRAAAARTAVLFLANLVAAVWFAVFGPVHWAAAACMGIGTLIGGRLGPIVVRHSPEQGLRVVIALAGIGLAVHLGLNAY